MENKEHVIALDGPSGSGKSTIARKVAQKLDLLYLNTGAMFRALGIVLKDRGYELKAEESLVQELLTLNFRYGAGERLVEIDGRDLTEEIKKHEVSALASRVSQNKDVREYLKNLQRQIARERPSILDGRDIGTVIFPQAILKIFLTADSLVRAQRRLEELQSRDSKGSWDLESIHLDIKERDDKDTHREIAPLKKAADAVEVDATNLTVEQVVNQIVSLYQERIS